jgi:coenzyme F420-0:L-glutamate ligase/coenzyme F420-1:gamma-L-glutamate ligase
MAVIDELAAAGELVKGKSDQVPVAVVRGYRPHEPATGDGPGAAALLRDAESDMFSLGTAEARAAGLRDAARLGEGAQRELPGLPVDPEAVRRALATVAGQLAGGTTVTDDDTLPAGSATAALHLRTRDTSPAGLMRLGADAHRLRAALAAESVASVALPHEDGIRLSLSGL